MRAELVGVFVGSAVGTLKIDVNKTGVGNFVDILSEGVTVGSAEGADVITGFFVGVVVVDDK